MCAYTKPAVFFCKNKLPEMESAKNEWSKKAVLRLIELYKENECLYDPKNRLYHNKDARCNAMAKIAESLHELMPNVAISDVKIKITTLRGQYAKMLQKLREKNSGSLAEDQFEPSAYWFEHMQFLTDYMSVRKVGSNFTMATNFHYSDTDTGTGDTHVLKKRLTRAKRSRGEPTSSSTCSVNDDGTDNVISAATKVLSAIITNHAETKKSENEDFCKFIKSEMDKITNCDLKDELIEEITTLVFETKRKQKMLNRSKIRSNEYYELTNFD